VGSTQKSRETGRDAAQLVRLAEHLRLACEFHHRVFGMFPCAVREVAVRLDEKIKAGFDLIDQAHHCARREELIVSDVELQRVEPLRVVFKSMLWF